MRLEKQISYVWKAIFDTDTYLADGVLHLKKEDLIKAAEDIRFESVDFEIAHPGESCRIMSASDCVQPIFKPGEDGATFPGIVDEIKRVGEGPTFVLDGVCVTEALLRPMVIASFIDMSGPAVDLSLHIPHYVHVCLLAKPKDEVENNDYFDAVNVASKKVAKFIAQKVYEHGVDIDNKEVYELDENVSPDLPRVAYLFQIFSHAPLTDTVYYGDGCATMLPTIVQPQEILDGAMTFRDYYQVTNASPTVSLQNHPMIKELMRRHGKDINFVGVIVSNTPAEVVNKRRNAMMNAGLAKYVLKADCAIITKEGGGHPQIDVGLNCDEFEKLGIKTVLMLAEFLSAGNPIEELVLFSTTNADAMVTTGCNMDLEFPKMDRVIGMESFPNKTNTGMINSYGPFEYDSRSMRDVESQIGNTDFESEVW